MQIQEFAKKFFDVELTIEQKNLLEGLTIDKKIMVIGRRCGVRDRTHFFTEKTEDTWNVVCALTGGSFNTSLWRCEKYPQGYCPCCGVRIK